jgi:RNA polymerase sigma factor (sigma-70 family)
MDDPLKLVQQYRAAATLDERLRLGEAIIRLVSPDIRVFLMGLVPHGAVADICQETFVAIAKGLLRFEGLTAKSFFAWCYSIARNKLNDHLRRQCAEERVTSFDPEQLVALLDGAVADSAISPQDRLDLDEAMQALTISKPECRDYLWKHFVSGFEYAEIAEESGLTYDGVRMKIGRCLEVARTLMAQPSKT